MQPVKLIGRAASTAVQTVRHPVSSAAYAAGIARGLAEAALHSAGAKAHRGEDDAAPMPDQRADAPATYQTASTVREPEVVPKPVPPPGTDFGTIVIEAADEEPGEAFATEPKAVSRESEHGGSATDAEIDAWIDEAMNRDHVDDAATTVHTSESGAPARADAESVLDPAVAKAIRKESEMMRKDAERDPS